MLGIENRKRSGSPMMDNSVSSNGFAGSVPVVTNPPSGGATSPSSLYKRASRALGVTALLAVLAVGLLLLLPGGLAWAQDDTIEYPEKGTGAVATFTAVDPEGTAITWTLEGVDVLDFKISPAGVLTFAEVPNFEASTGGGPDGTLPTYSVTVVATDSSYDAAVSTDRRQPTQWMSPSKSPTWTKTGR